MNRPRPRSEPAPVVANAGALARGFEFAATTVVFSVVGWFVDRTVHTAPVFVVAFTVLGLVGQFVRIYYAYSAEMRAHEAALFGPARAAAAARPVDGIADRTAP
jgi:F0F1-type ATP synthase assembly protein I